MRLLSFFGSLLVLVFGIVLFCGIFSPSIIDMIIGIVGISVGLTIMGATYDPPKGWGGHDIPFGGA